VESVVEQEESGLKDRTSKFLNNQGLSRVTAVPCKPVGVVPNSRILVEENERGLRKSNRGRFRKVGLARFTSFS
jgi:hypothetical protein